MMTRTKGIQLSLFVLLMAGAGRHEVRAQPETARQSAEPAQVAVIGADYAFVELPPTIAAGPTLFSFQNRGAKRHEMSITLLTMGVAVDSLLAAGERATVGSRAVSDSIVGLLIARPRERSGGQLYANLIAGRTYIVICTLRDTPDARRHADLGMVGYFLVR